MGPPYIGPGKPSQFDGDVGLITAMIIALILVTCVMFLPMIFGWV